MLSPVNQGNSELIGCILAMDEALGEAVFIQQLKSSLQRPELLTELEHVGFALCFLVGTDDVLLSGAVLDKMQSCERYALQRSIIVGIWCLSSRLGWLSGC